MKSLGNVARQVRGYSHHLCLLIVLLVAVAFAPRLALALDPPYPPSPVIKDLVWDFSSLRRSAQESDLFPLTWAADGHLYTAWGDGYGFRENGDKRSLGVSMVSGSPTSHSGTDLWAGVGKALGLISIDGVLYIVVTDQGKWMRGTVGRSTNHGRTWTFADSPWTFDEPGGVFAAPGLLQFGQDYRGARDDYVYGYSEQVRETIQPHIVMFRVPKTQLMNRSAYEFFAGRDGGGNPKWTKNIGQMQPVFTDPNGVVWGVQAMYHPVLRRYILTVAHNKNGGWGIFDAPEPWGPWTTVAYYDNWIDSHFKFTFSFNQKWMSGDGKTMWMAFTGVDEHDAFNVIKGTLSTDDPVASPDDPVASPDDPVASPHDPAAVVFAVNAGGPQYVDANGILYEADTLFTGGHTSTKQVAIAGTQDAVLYQSERWGNFSYTIPLPNGDYVVTLKFVEIFFSGRDKRVFDVKIEGTEVLSNLDLVAEIGPRSVYDVAVPVRVQDGVLDIMFHADVENAQVSAIVVEAVD